MIQPGQVLTLDDATEALSMQKAGVAFQARFFGDAEWLDSNTWYLDDFRQMQYRRAPDPNFQWEAGKYYKLEGGGHAKVIRAAKHIVVCYLLSDGVKDYPEGKIPMEWQDDYWRVFENGRVVNKWDSRSQHPLNLTQVECNADGTTLSEKPATGPAVQPEELLRFVLEMSLGRMSREMHGGDTNAIFLASDKGFFEISKAAFIEETAKAIESQPMLREYLETICAKAV